VSHGIRVLELTVERRSLEQTVLELTGHSADRMDRPGSISAERLDRPAS